VTGVGMEGRLRVQRRFGEWQAAASAISIKRSLAIVPAHSPFTLHVLQRCHSTNLPPPPPLTHSNRRPTPLAPPPAAKHAAADVRERASAAAEVAKEKVGRGEERQGAGG